MHHMDTCMLPVSKMTNMRFVLHPTICQKVFKSFLMPPSTYMTKFFLSNYSTCLSPISTSSLNWGRLLLEPLFGTQMMGGLTRPHRDPNSKYLKLFKPDQNDKTGPEILLTAHFQKKKKNATSLTKEPCFTFVAVEQPSIFKPCKKINHSPCAPINIKQCEHISSWELKPQPWLPSKW